MRGRCVSLLKSKWQTNGVLLELRALSLLQGALILSHTHAHICAVKSIQTHSFPFAVSAVLMYVRSASH